MKKSAITVFLLLLILIFSACSSQEKEITVGFIYSGSIADQGINQAQENARLDMVEAMNGKVSTVVKESVTPESVSSVIFDMINKDCSLIFISDNSFDNQVLEASQIYDDVKFVVYNSQITAANVKSCSNREYEIEYLAGVVAGDSTDSNLIGYMAQNQKPNTYVDINSFALGVASVNPEAKIQVDWINIPYTRNSLNASVSQLIFNGCDVLTTNLDNNSALIEASDRGVKVIGGVPSGLSESNKYLTALTYDFQTFYTETIESVLNNSFDNTHYVGTLANGFLGLDDLSFSVSPKAREDESKAQEEIINGNLAVFTGPIVNNQGVTVAEENRVLNETDLAAMNYVLNNVEILN